MMIAYQLDGVSVDNVRRYYAEIDNSSELQALYREARATDNVLRNLTDIELRAGRQLLYYGLARIMKPRVIFEAGTAHGIGSLLLLHALMRNVQEGHPGRLVTVDINPNAGKLLFNRPASYQMLLDFECSDSESRLARVPESIDLFLHDTVNIAAHERRHYSLLQTKLSARGIICTTWGASGQLAHHAYQHGRRYVEFTSEASGHWCSDTLGISAPTSVSMNRTAVDIASPEHEPS